MKRQTLLLDFEGAREKENKRTLRALLIILPVVLAAVGIMIAFPNPTTLAVCIAVVSGAITINNVIGSRIEFKKINNQFEGERGSIPEIKPEEEKDIEQILEEEIGEKKVKISTRIDIRNWLTE
jgi:hypothetical protein